MPGKNLRECSRQQWVSHGEKATQEEINIGSFQRIADAMEIISQRYLNLIADRDRFKAAFDQERIRNGQLKNSLAATRAWVTRLKRKGKSVPGKRTRRFRHKGIERPNARFLDGRN